MDRDDDQSQTGGQATDRRPPARAERSSVGPPAPNRDARDRHALVERHLGLARHLARRYANSGEPLDDLIQVASLGLVKAVDRFDPDRGIPFSAYAVPTILGELRRHFRDRSWAIHVPRDLKEAAQRVEHALAQHAGRSPTPAQLADETGLALEVVLDALEASTAHRALSLDAPARSDDDAAAPTTLADRIGDEDDDLARARDRATVEQLIETLAPREREILRLRFAEDLTQAEIGARIGVSQMHVSRLLRTTLIRLRLASRTSP